MDDKLELVSGSLVIHFPLPSPLLSQRSTLSVLLGDHVAAGKGSRLAMVFMEMFVKPSAYPRGLGKWERVASITGGGASDERTLMRVYG